MVDRETVRRGYDEIAEQYAEERSEEGREMEILSRFLDQVESPARILDAGCGQGTPVLKRLCSAGTAVGVDLSRNQLRLARTNAPEAAVTQGDITRLPVRQRSFDAITAFQSLIHVPLEDHQRVIDEFARILRPGGRVLLSEGPEEWSGTNPDWLDSGIEMQWDVAGKAATREQLRAAGFSLTNEWDATGTFDDAEEHWVFFAARLESEEE